MILLNFCRFIIKLFSISVTKVLANSVQFLFTVMCSLQPDTGPCEALSFRYFWNITTRQCEIFQYGGCDGNFNRFSDAKSCANQCGK